MVTLREVDAQNFDGIVSLKRESNLYVGSPAVYRRKRGQKR